MLLWIPIPRILLQSPCIELLYIPALKWSQRTVKSFVQLGQRPSDIPERLGQNIWRQQLTSEEGKASKVVPLEKVFGVVHAACEVRHIDTSEGVDLAEVAADLGGLGVRDGVSHEILAGECERVFIVKRSAIPVVRDAVPAGSPVQIVALAKDGPEGFEGFFAEVALGKLFGMVRC